MDLSGKTQALADRMAAKLRVKGADLAEIAERAGRKLPSRVKADIQALIQAEEMARHPKLARRVDTRVVAKAERNLERFLESQNSAAERRGKILDAIAKVVFVLFVIALGAFFWLMSRGAFG